MKRKKYKNLKLNDLLSLLESSPESSREHHLARRAIYYRLHREELLEAQKAYTARQRQIGLIPDNRYKQIAEYLRLNEAGMSQVEIAQKFGISRQAVSEGIQRARALKKAGKI